MKFAFLVIAIFINFFNHSLIKSEEKIFSAKNKIENIAKKESITEEKTEIKKIHIVKSGDTISSISKFYSINKDLIIKLNNLKDENYIFVGQNLIISESTENLTKQSDLINYYHIVQAGENLTGISNKYNSVVVLKSHETLICKEDKIYICDKGNPGMATAGMGDVLSGMISGLIAQKLSLFEAACLGVDLHARAGDIYSKKNNQQSLLPTDIIDLFARVINE